MKSSEERKAYQKAYYANPENRARIKAYSKAYYANPENRARIKINAEKPEVKAHYKAYQKLYANKPENNERMKAHYKAYDLKRNYNITIEDYNKLFEKQQGKCAICGKHQNELKRKLAVDHNHITGEIRGLLCGNCNKILGFAYEDINILQNTIKYMKIKNEIKK
jgi:hypothetical protein